MTSSFPIENPTLDDLAAFVCVIRRARRTMWMPPEHASWEWMDAPLTEAEDGGPDPYFGFFTNRQGKRGTANSRGFYGTQMWTQVNMSERAIFLFERIGTHVYRMRRDTFDGIQTVRSTLRDDLVDDWTRQIMVTRRAMICSQYEWLCAVLAVRPSETLAEVRAEYAERLVSYRDHVARDARGAAEQLTAGMPSPVEVMQLEAEQPDLEHQEAQRFRRFDFADS